MAINYTDAAYQTEQDALARRRKIIEALMQGGKRQEMAGDRVIPMSGVEMAGKLATALLGAYASKQADEEQKGIATKYQAEMNQRLSSGLADYDKMRAPHPVEGAMPDDGMGPGAPVQAPGDQRGAMMALLNSGHPILQSMGSTMMAKTAPVGNVNPSDYTPDSMARYVQSQNYADLVPREKGEFVDENGKKQLRSNYSGRPIGDAFAVGMSDKDKADLWLRGGTLGNEQANTRYNTGQNPGVVLPPGIGGGFMTGPQPGAAPQRMIAGGSPPMSPGPGGPPGLPPKLANEMTVAAAKAEQEGLAKGGVDYKTALDARVQTGSDLMMRVEEARKAVDQFKPGMGADARLLAARVAQQLPGVSDDLVRKINGGDVAAKQEFQKLAAQQAMETLKQSMGGSGRITQAEFKVFQANNPNIELDPNAIQKIYNFSTRVYQRDSLEQQQLSTHIEKGGRLSAWPTIWNQRAQQLGIVNPKIVDVKDGPSVNQSKTGLVPNAQGGFDYIPPK